jgi:glucokinase
MRVTPAFFGIEIGGTKLQLHAFSADAVTLARRRAEVRPNAEASGIRAQILSELAALRRNYAPAAVGIGFGGPVDWRTGIIARSFHVEGWTHFALGPWLAGELKDIPVFVENDANVAALAEALHGAGRGANPVLYSNSGSGIGAGLVIGGRLYHGRPPGELELGHLRLDAAGRTVQDLASGWALDLRVQREAASCPKGHIASLLAANPGKGAHVLAAALVERDAAANVILHDTARHYALALSHAIHLLHPEVVVLGGGVSLLGEPWREAVARHLPDFLMDAFKPGPRVLLSALGESVVPLGAAMLAQSLLAQPKSENMPS